MMRMYICTFAPWHKWVKCEPVSAISDKLTCSCGRAYGMNNSERIMLPWHMVSNFYDDRIFKDDLQAQAAERRS